MIQHISFFQLNPEVDGETLESMVRATRSLLLKIPEVLSVRSGRNLDSASPWPFFLAFETDSRAKLQIVLDDPFHLKLMEKFIGPHTREKWSIEFELDPSKSLKYS